MKINYFFLFYIDRLKEMQIQIDSDKQNQNVEICMERRMDHCWNSSETSVPQWSKETKLELSLADKNVAG